MIYLVRHGQTDWNIKKIIQGHTDISLNDNGRKQAKIVSEVIKKYKIDKIYSSDLRRAKQTANIINENYGFTIISDHRLREMNYGDLEGIAIPTISQDVWDIYNSNPEKLHAEPISNVYHRIKSFFEEIDLNDNMIIVTHGGTLRVMMYYMKNKDKFNKEIYDKEYRNTKIKNGSIYEWNVNENLLNVIDI